MSEVNRKAMWRLLMLAVALLVSGPILAQDASQSSQGSVAVASSPASGIPAEEAEIIDASLQRLNVLRGDIDRIESGLDGAEGLRLAALEVRLARYWDEIILEAHAVAEKILSLTEQGHDTSAYEEPVRVVLTVEPVALFAEIDRASAGVILPSEDQSAAEQAAVDARAGAAIERVLDLYQALHKNIELSTAYGMDSAAIEREFDTRLMESAASTSAFLDLSVASADAIRSQLDALPTNTEIAARLAVTERRVGLSSRVLKSLTGLMVARELNTSLYEAQLIASTGEITTGIFEVSVLTDLATAWLGSLGEWLREHAGGMFFSLFLFVVIVAVFIKLAGIAQRLITKGLSASRIRVSQLLHRMIVSTTRSVIIVIGLLIALSQLGISLGPLLAGLGIAGFVIGFALQDSLANFASGLMILIYRPFDVGEVVEVGSGVFGTVNHMSLVNTTVLTFDNQTLIVPNNAIWQNVIKNVTAQRTRRVDLVFGIGYSDDIPKAERILREIVEEHEAVLADPEPMVRLNELGDSSVNFVVRPWVKTDDYWPVYWDITREVKLRFDAEGISIPFPQRDVHLFTEATSVGPTTKSAGKPAGSTSKFRRENTTATSDVADDD